MSAKLTWTHHDLHTISKVKVTQPEIKQIHAEAHAQNELKYDNIRWTTLYASE